MHLSHLDDTITNTMGDIKRPYYKHYFFEIKCNFEQANSIDWLEKKTDSFLDVLGIKKLETVYHHFHPQGITLVHILSASHIAIHSWPENGYVQADFISCQKDIDLQRFILAVDKVFQEYQHKAIELNY